MNIRQKIIIEDGWQVICINTNIRQVLDEAYSEDEVGFQ